MAGNKEKEDRRRLIAVAKTVEKKKLGFSGSSVSEKLILTTLELIQGKLDRIWSESIDKDTFVGNFPHNNADEEKVDYLYRNCIHNININLYKPLLAEFLYFETTYFNWRAALENKLRGISETGPKSEPSAQGTISDAQSDLSDDKPDGVELSAVFEGRLDREAMARALEAVMSARKLSFQAAADIAKVHRNDVRRAASGQASVEKSCEILRELGCEVEVVVRKSELG